ncbi:DUF397 domain-containing protein [Streptomyces olivaceus]|uniref:DUF397 domain-containing protein n=1 Tax=Streptomyces olivaceus TaxID=47716 RepID=UPI001CCAC236|nr:DUF397 domain-containing protein [Streptomyces olivaceus]
MVERPWNLPPGGLRALDCGSARPSTNLIGRYPGGWGSWGAGTVHKGQPLWRRSSVCGNESECVEVAVREGRVWTRDSKAPARSPLPFTHSVWAHFLQAVAQGELSGL